MSVRELAERDIREELSIQGKCFMAFHEELNEIMDALVEEQSNEQLKVSKV